MGRNIEDFLHQKVTDFNSYGKTTEVFCRENNLNCKIFYRWIKRLRKDPLLSTTKSNFNEIQTSPPASQSNFLINIANFKTETFRNPLARSKLIRKFSLIDLKHFAEFSHKLARF